jgi:hypothetical protein
MLSGPGIYNFLYWSHNCGFLALSSFWITKLAVSHNRSILRKRNKWSAFPWNSLTYPCKSVYVFPL